MNPVALEYSSRPRRRIPSIRPRRWLIVWVVVSALVICLFPVSESRYEFDAVNMRLRARKVTRAWLVNCTYYSQSTPPVEHPTAARLRELRVLAPIVEADSSWLLIKGFKPGARGWIGPGRHYLRALGHTTFATAVPMPANEDLSKNLWIRWAVKDPEATRRFWSKFQKIAKTTPVGPELLLSTRDFVEMRDLQVNTEELEGRINQFARERARIGAH